VGLIEKWWAPLDKRFKEGGDVELLSPVEQGRLIKSYLTTLFGGQTGYLCLAHMKPARGQTWTEEWFNYPEQVDQFAARAIELAVGHNVYTSPMLFSSRKRTKENVEVTPVIWSDLDACDPVNLHIAPTMVIESSPGRYQGYWAMQFPVDPDDAENLAKRIAYKHAEQGADRSGWDLTQMLRVPGTFNYKYGAAEEIPSVKILELNRKVYRIEDFEDDYPQLKDYSYVTDPMPESLPDGDDIMQSKRSSVNPRLWQLYNEEPTEDWSKALWNMQMLLFESGFTREEVFAVAMEARCNKYRRDKKQLSLLWKEVCRSSLRYEQNEFTIAHGGIDEEQVAIPLLSAEERKAVLQSKDTFVERYSEWARSLGDAAPQYHQAGAFVALSSILAGRVRLPTSFGTIIPNLWFMILADTTLTRKTTAMDISMDMIVDIDPDCILATDGSIEGLMRAMSLRPGRPSVFLRDEFSGLLEQMTKKDYMSGMPELLTKLYDGKMQKRVLSKETIEVREPILIMFAGGIKNKVTSLLTTEQVSSGFMPRFIFITAESDISRLKPLGPPSTRMVNNGEAIKNELTDIFTFYSKMTTITIKSLQLKEETQKHFEAKLTDEAWIRYNELETAMLEMGISAKHPDLMTPTYDRLSKSILKAAVLLAASRMEEEPTVTKDDILRAIFYGEAWKTYAEEVLDNIGKGAWERQLQVIHAAIDRKPGIPRSTLMQNYHLDSRTASVVFDTLEQRGLIMQKKLGRGSVYYSTSKGFKS
jgi:hypothetical protein